MNEVKIFLHPGYIRSKNDGETHYISARQLAKLYNVNFKECIISSNNEIVSTKDQLHLFPLYHGDYDTYMEKD